MLHHTSCRIFYRIGEGKIYPCYYPSFHETYHLTMWLLLCRLYLKISINFLFSRLLNPVKKIHNLRNRTTLAHAQLARWHWIRYHPVAPSLQNPIIRMTSPMSENDARIVSLIDLPVIHDVRGNLTFIEGNRQIPFEIKRVYYLYDVPGGAHRGGHAHKNLHQLIISASGSFDVIVDNGKEKLRFRLNRPYFGLYLPPMTWREIDDFSSGSFCLVLASGYYDESDYLRDYSDFLAAAGIGT